MADNSRPIKKLAVKVSIGHAICGIALLDEDDEIMLEYEWENCEFGREWKTKLIPDNFELVGIKVNTTQDDTIITRLGFIFHYFEEGEESVSEPELLREEEHLSEPELLREKEEDESK